MTMAKLARTIEVTRQGKAYSLKVDGEEFPWLVGSSGINVDISTQPDKTFPSITLTILADSVRVIDEAQTNPEGRGGQIAGDL